MSIIQQQMKYETATIRTSPASIWCMSCNTTNGSETHFMTINGIRAQCVCLNTDILSICEECICVWAMVNDRNYHFAINKKHINCVRHWQIIHIGILNYKLFLCIVFTWFSMSTVTIPSISLCSCQCVYPAWVVWLYVFIFYFHICRYCWCFQMKFLSWTNKPISRGFSLYNTRFQQYIEALASDKSVVFRFKF